MADQQDPKAPQAPQPGQQVTIPASNYDLNKDLGRVIDRTNIVDAPTAPNLLYNTNAGFTADGVSKVNPLYAQYLTTLKDSPVNPIRQPYYTNLTKAERYLNNDYGGFQPFDQNLENWYGENQSWFKQVGNRIGKFAIKGLGSFANSLMDVPNTINAVSEGNVDKMWDNPTNNWASDMINWSEKNLPNYETNWEREHPFLNLIPLYGNAGNGWGKVLENVGFTVGAIGGAVVEDLIVGGLTGGVGEIPLAAVQINKAVYRLGKLINSGEDTASALRQTIRSADDIVRGLKGIDRFNYAIRQGLWGANMITSGFSEAAFEGIESHKTLTNDLRKQFFEANGRNPNYDEAREIEEYGRSAANARFLMNSALLAVTNTIQWGDFLRPFNATRDLLNQEIRAGARVGLQEGSIDVFRASEITSRLGRFTNTLKNNALSRAIVGSSSEGFEEGAQYAIEVGVNDYYKRAYDTRGATETNDFMKSFTLGLSKTLGTQEGWENIVYGLLGGMMYKGGESAYYKLQGRETPNYQKQLQAVIDGLNSESLTGIFENKYAEGVSAASIQADLIASAKNGNMFQFQNFKHEQFVNFVISGIRQNKFDTRVDQLNELKKLSPEDFQKTFGIPATDDNKSAVSEYVDSLARHAEYINDVNKRVNRTFINPYKYRGTGNYRNQQQIADQNEENEKYLIYEKTKEQLIYTMAVSRDSSNRISQLRANIAQAEPRLNTDTVIRLANEEGLKELQTEYKDRAKTFEEALKITPADKIAKRELKWLNERITQMDEIFSKPGETVETYNKLLNEVIRYELNGVDKRKKSNIDTLVLKEMMQEAKDIYFLQNRNDVAIDSYIRLTTPGGFKGLYDKVREERAKAAVTPIQLQPEVVQPANPQQTEALTISQIEQGIQPDLESYGLPADFYNTGGIVSSEKINEDQIRQMAEYIPSILDGSYVPNKEELNILAGLPELKITRGFISADQVSEENKKKGHVIKATDGTFFVYKKDIQNALDFLKRFESTTPPIQEPPIPAGEGKGKSPLRIEDFIDKVFVPEDLRPPFNASIFSGSKEDVVKDLSINIQALSPERQAEYDKQKQAQSFTPVPNYPGVFAALSPVNISILHNGVEIGKLPTPERLLFKIGDQYVNLPKLTVQQYTDLTGRPASQYQQDVDNYKKYVGFKNYMATLFKNNNNEPVTVPSSLITTLLGADITYGKLDLVTNIASRPLFNDLQHTTISNTDDNGQVIRSKVIVSMPKSYVNDTEVRQRTENFNLIYEQSFYDNGGNENVVRDWVNKNLKDIHLINSRYLTLIQTPDGALRPVALRAGRASKESLDNAFTTIRDTAIASANENLVEAKDIATADGYIYIGDKQFFYKLPNDAAKKRNDIFNKELDNKFYITDNKGEVRYDISVSPVGAVRLSIYKPSPVESKEFRTKIFISPKKFDSALTRKPIQSFEDLISAFNEEITKQSKKDTRLAALNLSLSTTNFTENIPYDTERNTTVDTIGSLLTAATTSQVFTNGTMRIRPNGTEVEKAFNNLTGTPPINSNSARNPNAPVFPKERAKEANNYIAELLENDVIDAGYINMAKSSAIQFLEFIAQQAQNYDSNWNKLLSPDAYQATVDSFGQSVVDFAIELFPGPSISIRPSTSTQTTSPLDSTIIYNNITYGDLNRLKNELGNLNVATIQNRFKLGYNAAIRALAEFNRLSGQTTQEGSLLDTLDIESIPGFGPVLSTPSDEMINPNIVTGGIFGGLQQMDEAEFGDFLGEDMVTPDQLTDAQPENITQIQNQEDTSDKVYTSVSDALASMNISFSNTSGIYIYTNTSTGEIIQNIDISPAELAKQLGLDVQPPKKSKEDFDFRIDEAGLDELNRQVSIEQARGVVYSMLPSFISVEDINKVLDKVSLSNDIKTKIFGAFSDGVIYLNNQTSTDTIYHEAFHAVFRMLLDDNQINDLLEKAQSQLYTELKNQKKSINDLLREKRELGLYLDLTPAQARDRLYEEYMADRFMNWKNKQQSAGFFDKLFDLIRRFFRWLSRSRTDLDALFRNIDTGQFRYTNIQSNRFTTETTDEFVEPEFVFSLIPSRPSSMEVGSKSIQIKRNLPSDRSKDIIQSVAAYYNIYKHMSEFKNITDERLLDQILNDLKSLYNRDNPVYLGYTEDQLKDIENSDEAYIYSNEESRNIIKEGAKKYIESIKYIEQFRYEEQEDEESDTGQPSSGYDNKSENIGGYSSLPGLLRQYIGFTSYEVQDRFGNVRLINNVPLVSTVDAIQVYYGLLRATANTTDPVRLLQKMNAFSEDNPQVQQFFSKFVKDTGLNLDALMNENIIEAEKNKNLLELVKKGFNKYRIEYVFTEQDIKKQTTKSYAANRRNVENIQFDKWSNQFLDTYTSYDADSQRSIRQSIISITNKYFDPRRTKKYNTQSLNLAVSEIQGSLRGVGIQLSRAYLKYVLLSQQAEQYENSFESFEDIFDENNKYITRQDYNYVQIMKIAEEITLTRDSLDQLSSLLASGSDPYFKEISKTRTVDEETGEVTIGEEEVDTAMITRLLNIAKGNALFDESVGESSYTNAENKTVYAHQDGTFHVKFSYLLRDANFRKQLREEGYREEETSYRDVYDTEWLTKNRLLNSEEFETIADNLLFQRIDGMRAVETNKLGKIITQEFRDQKEGVTYGHYSAREFITNLMNMYVSFSKVQTTSQGSVRTAPHLIRVLEASKTADTVNLPIQIDLYRDGTVTSKVVDQVYSELQKEINRIQRVVVEVGSLTENIVENYHTGSLAEDGFTITKGYRGLQLTDNMTSLLSAQNVEIIQNSARTNTSLTQDQISSIRNDIEYHLNKMVDGTVDVMESEGIVKRNEHNNYIRKDGRGYTSLLQLAYFEGNEELNLKANRFKDNVGHVVINDYLNTLSYNQILHGDSALSLKNDGGIDAIKRAKGDNAAIISMRTDTIEPMLGINEAFTHSSIAIFKEPKGINPFYKEGSKDKKQIDVADAQMYATVNSLRYTLWGLGRLTPRLAKVLDAMEKGEDIHSMIDESGKEYDGVFDESNGILKWDEMTNSLKLVYKDSKSYFKMSVVVLQKTLTSYQDREGEWISRPGWETLHNLRTQMEKKGIHFSAPESASKMMTIDVSKAADFSDLKGHLYDNTYFGLQTENPSNKLENTTPTQLLQIIDSEQDDNAEVSWYGNIISVAKLRDIYQTYISQKIQNSYDTVKQEIYTIKDLNQDVEESIKRGEITPNLSKFFERAKSSLETTGADAQTLEFFSLDENGQPIYNVNMSSIKTKATQLYLAYFSKGVLSQKNPGYTVALMSGINTKTIKVATRIVNGEVVEWDHIRRDAFDANYDNIQNKTILGSPSLVTQVGQYFLDELRYNVPERDENGDIIPGKYFSEMMLPAHFQELLKLDPNAKLPDAIANLFGSRIPLQDKHSMMSFKMIDFLPANLGSTGMFPKELIKLSGADFDIDKEFIIRYDIYFVNKKGRVLVKKYGDVQNIEDRWYEYKSWMSKNNKSVKALVREMAENDPEYRRLIREGRFYDVANDNLNDMLGKDFIRAIKAEHRDIFITKAFKQLNLPSTIEEFLEASKTKELNNGVINNRLLDAYIALLTNSGIQEIAQTPATLTNLEQVQFEDDIVLRDRDGNIISSAFSRKNKYPVDSMVGKYYGFRNNSTGKDNIGIDVVANLTYSVMNKGNIGLREQGEITFPTLEPVRIDGRDFRTFSGTTQYNLVTKAFDGPRTNDLLSTLISSATDEAKEQLNALYNLNVDAVKMVAYLVSLKVPLKSAIYFVNQPSILNYLRIKAVRQNTLQTTQEENTFRTVFRERALEQTNNQIRDYKQYTNNELADLFEAEGYLKIEC